MRPRSALLRAVTVTGLPAVLIGSWWVASGLAGSLYFPPLSGIVAAFPDTWLSGDSGPRLLNDVLPSLARLGAGYLLAAVLGIGGGVLIGRVPWLRATVEPVLEIGRAVPPPVVFPVLVALAGIGDVMKVLVIVFGCVWPILLNTVEGVRAVDPVSEETCRSFRLGAAARLRVLVVPSASPQIMTGLRQALSIGVILMVVSEMFAASNGIGFTVVQFQRTFAIPQMWTGIILLGVLGVLLSGLLRLLEARVLGWHRGIRRAHHDRE